jgi:benzoyl-CoA reductase subunit D
MLTVGIDSGNQNTKTAVLSNGKVIGSAVVPTEFDARQAAWSALDKALADASVSRDGVDFIVATGAGRELIDVAQGILNEVGSAAKGARYYFPETEMVIDLGGEGCRAIRLETDGRIKNYEVNDKCASGAGTFIETMARALQISTAEMGGYSLKHTRSVPMNAQCVVFAESEVISLIHNQEKKEDIAYAIHVGICNRINALVRRAGTVQNITMIGGPGMNQGLVECLSEVLRKNVAVCEDTMIASAVGAAIHAGIMGESK